MLLEDTEHVSAAGNRLLSFRKFLSRGKIVSSATMFFATALFISAEMSSYGQEQPTWSPRAISAGLAAVEKPTIDEGFGFAPTNVNSEKPSTEAPPGMLWIPGGVFSMGGGSDAASMCAGVDVMADARPIHRVYVDGFWMDATEVTNEQFEKFVTATGYVTIAERQPKAEDFPGAPHEALVPGSLVFDPPSAAVPLNDYRQWWRYQAGANWRRPEGPGSKINDRGNYPVVHVAYADAMAYAKWAGKRLPTEAEFEFAARGGLSGMKYAWGDDLRQHGRWMANIYQGPFPTKDTGDDGFAGIAPVKSFPPNAYGLYDVAGNVWEWCSDWYQAGYYAELKQVAAISRNPGGPPSPDEPAALGQRERVQRGGSFLCTDQYCTRYMVGSRGKGEVDTSSNHVGFRCVVERNPPKT